MFNVVSSELVSRILFDIPLVIGITFVSGWLVLIYFKSSAFKLIMVKPLVFVDPGLFIIVKSYEAKLIRILVIFEGRILCLNRDINGFWSVTNINFL